jgi:hypothetical protein
VSSFYDLVEVLQPIAVPVDVEHMEFVEDPVGDGRGDHQVAEDLVPPREAAVRS